MPKNQNKVPKVQNRNTTPKPNRGRGWVAGSGEVECERGIENIFQKKFSHKKFTSYPQIRYAYNMSLVANQEMQVTEEERIELQSHYPYAGVKLSELSVQEERLILFHLRGLTKAAAGRAAGYRNLDHVYEVFKKPKIQKAIEYLREEMREEVRFDRNTATTMYLEAHRKSATATEEKNVVDSLCKLHGLFAPEQATQVNINVDKIEQLERLPDAELLRIAGVDTSYLEPKREG